VGQRILAQVRTLLADAELLEAEIRGEAREPAGGVTLGSLPSISYPIMGRLFSQLRAKYPAVHLKVLEGSSGQVEEWLTDGRVDIAILYRYGANVPVLEQTLAVVDSHLIGCKGDKLTLAAELPFKALNGLPFILPGAPNGLRTALDSVARQEHIRLSPVIEADSLPLMRSLVAQERLYTVLPVHAVWQEVQDGRLQAARIVDPPFQRTVSMAFARSKGPARAVSIVAAEIQHIVQQSALTGMWRSSADLAGHS
jgi:DNA-binding transcriptional LysR family regulator